MKYIRDIFMVLTGLLLLCALPALFYGGVGFRYVIETLMRNGGEFGFYPIKYFSAIKEQAMLIVQPHLWELQSQGKSYPFLEAMESRYLYSMKVFLLALLAALAITLLFSIIHSLLPGFFKKVLTGIIDLLEALPDVFIIVGLQLTVILIFRKTGNLVAEIAMLNEEIYFLPVLCLTIVPAVFLLKTTTLLLKEEESKQYVDLARAKGMNRLYILLIHSFRNVAYSLFYRSKIIFAFMLSNLFIIERLFNMRGLMEFLTWSTGYSFVLISMSIFLPFYFIFSLGEFVLMKKTGQGKEEELYV